MIWILKFINRDVMATPISAPVVSPPSSTVQGGCQASLQGAQALSSVQAPFPLPHPDMAFWQRQVQAWYPGLNNRTYFQPPVHMNRTRHQEVRASGQNVLMTQPLTLESDARDDETHQCVLGCLQQLVSAESEVMFVISQLQFGNYLNEPSYAAAASLLARAGDPLLKLQKKDEGDFDVLVLDRNYGVLACEVKSVGGNFALLSLPQQQEDAILGKKVKQAIGQLEKSRDVLTFLIPGVHQCRARIRTTLMVPNISAAQLQRVLTANQQLREDLCQCLGLAVSEDPVPLCLTSDVVTSSGQWWRQLMAGAGRDPAMTDSVYLDLVSRFGGPATTVTVFCSSVPRLANAHRPDLRTPGEGVQETANRFAPVDLVLHPKQVDILNNRQRLVFLVGPPGTGKTLVLLVKALDWLHRGKHVQVVSSHMGSLAVSNMIVNQLIQTGGAAFRRRIHLHQFDLATGDGDPIVERAVKTLEGIARRGELYVIVDEACRSGNFKTFCTELINRVPRLYMWAASIRSVTTTPAMRDVVLTEPLRSPPNITKEVRKTVLMRQGGDVSGYTAVPSPLPSNGPVNVGVLHEGQGHLERYTYDCRQCGKEIARVLHELGVGGAGRSTPNSPPPLRYKDVFMLTFGQYLEDTETDASGKVTRPASGVVEGLREGGVPVMVLRHNDAPAIADVGIMTPQGDQVVASEVRAVSGLERKVVVWLQGTRAGDEASGRLQVMSRSTAQLICVRPEQTLRN